MNVRKRLLLVEDEVIIAMTEKVALEKYGYCVTTVHSGEKAVEIFDGEAPIDLVLMDIDLGKGIDGTRAAELILKKTDVPIVFFSSHTEPEIVEKTENITSYGYIVKNSSMTVLDASIKMAFKLFYANQKAEESKMQFSLFMDYLPAVVFLKDFEGRTLFMNKYMNTVLGSSDWLGKTMTEVFPNEFGQKLFSDDMEILKSGYKKLEETIPHTDGTMHWYETQKFTVENTNDDTLIGGISLDITGRKHTEAALRESEMRLLQAEKIAKIGNWMLHIDTATIISSKGANEIYGVNFRDVPLAEIQKIPLPEYRPLLDRALGDLVAGRNSYDLEFRICRPNDGAIVDIHSVATFDKPNNTVFGVIQDITERKKADGSIKTLLGEKELLLKEVHHRIKNNMNTITGLLSLQAESLADSTAAASLTDAANRIRGMTLLYDKLYGSSNFTEISIKDYFPALIDQIVRSFPNGNRIKIETDFADIPLDSKRLQPLGLIVNELLTNSMKYAFPGRNDGTISASAHHANGRIVISVADNGIGMSESVDFGNSTGFGLLLVHGLAGQLGGTIRIERKTGTKVVLEMEQ